MEGGKRRVFPRRVEIMIFSSISQRHFVTRASRHISPWNSLSRYQRPSFPDATHHKVNLLRCHTTTTKSTYRAATHQPQSQLPALSQNNHNFMGHHTTTAKSSFTNIHNIKSPPCATKNNQEVNSMFLTTVIQPHPCTIVQQRQNLLPKPLHNKHLFITLRHIVLMYQIAPSMKRFSLWNLVSARSHN